MRISTLAVLAYVLCLNPAFAVTLEHFKQACALKHDPEYCAIAKKFKTTDEMSRGKEHAEDYVPLTRMAMSNGELAQATMFATQGCSDGSTRSCEQIKEIIKLS